jgi:outer membrane protein assembly factor BamB
MIKRRNNMKKKILGIFVFMLLISTATQTMAINFNEDNLIYQNKATNNDADWWPMLGHDPQHTGCSTSIAPNTNKLNWSYSTGSDISSSSPVVFDNKLYIGTAEIGSKGKLNFELIKNQPIINILPIIKEMYQTDTGGIFCINTITGKKLWDFTTKSVVSSTPVVYNGCVYILSSDSDTYFGDLYCLDAETGVKQWNFTYKNLVTTPIIEDDNLYISTVDQISNYGKLLCLNPLNGVEKWSYSIGFNNSAMYSAPAVYNGRVFLTSLNSYDVELHCVNSATGEKEWDVFLTKMEIGLAASTPVIYKEKVFVMSMEAYLANQTLYSVLFCLDVESGDKIWKYVMEESEISLSTPAVSNGNVYFPYSENNLQYSGLTCVNASTGEVIWNQIFYYDFFLLSSPSIADGKLYLGSMNIFKYASVINCYNIFSGSLIWSYSVGELMIMGSSPTIANEKVYIAEFEGKIYAFKDNKPPYAPTINGPSSGNPGTSYEYGLISIDPDDDKIAKFIVDWGDSTEQENITGPFSSGQEVLVNHTWDEEGIYYIKAKAFDIYGNESDWSEFELEIPRVKKSYDSIFIRILERFLDAFQMIRSLLWIW